MSYVFGPSAGQPYYHAPLDDLPAPQPRGFYNSEPIQSHYFNGQTIAWHYGVGGRPNTPVTPTIPEAMDDGDTAQPSNSETYHIPLIPLTFPAIECVPDAEIQDYHYGNKYLVPQTEINQIPEMSLTSHTTGSGLDTTYGDTIDILSNNLRSFVF